MRKATRVGLGLLVAGTFTLIGSPKSFAADDGAKIFEDNCTRCHTSQVLKEKYLKSKQLSRDEWKETLARMKDLGAEVPRGKQDVLLDYLVQTFGAGGSPAGPAAK